MRFAWLALALTANALPVMAQQSLPWRRFDPLVASALSAFRRTDHWIAEAMALNVDGGQLGRPRDGIGPLNFDASMDLMYLVRDMNDDRNPEVFLLFTWLSVSGTDMPTGVVMRQVRPTVWRIACEFRDGGTERRQAAIALLPRRSHGWRHFRTSDGAYGWQPAPQGNGAMDCVPLPDAPPSRSRRAPPP